ncbi:hypothetical protein [Streptomyces rugosispiralis]|uniref:Uncharacterized protein n=1 Tax=Streptomyces rugosispiralis TaxID=2967341 RepID=A0ABT1V2F7_9ACTN|nr:hypothetical protein [Streptomyces rugosispiralis]MCQ8191569.1 hypothetical protein [Streptomyces rugosispiralis]
MSMPPGNRLDVKEVTDDSRTRAITAARHDDGGRRPRHRRRRNGHHGDRRHARHHRRHRRHQRAIVLDIDNTSLKTDLGFGYRP